MREVQASDEGMGAVRCTMARGKRKRMYGKGEVMRQSRVRVGVGRCDDEDWNERGAR